ncbi:unnamed protein product [Ectocarpus sp. CCAP 1310/34]|nr:unnamed protein product [Ectocarpus sp. CCAP 1310/34]
MSSRHGFLGTSSNSSSSGSNNSGGRRRRAGTTILVTVFEAETGKQLDFELSESGHDAGGATEALRRRLYSLTGVPAENQIILWGGPPYKPLRSQLPPASITVTVPSTAPTGSASSRVGSSSSSSSLTTTVATKIFLFDWRTLAPEQQQQHQQQRHRRSSSNSQIIGTLDGSLTPSGSSGGGGTGGVDQPLASSSAAPGVTGVDAAGAAAAESLMMEEAAEFVGPAEVTLPTEPGASPSPLPPVEGSYLLKTIAGYERGSMLTLNRGQAYLESSRRRLAGAETCAERMQTMVMALDAAVSNSLDHWDPLQRAYNGLKEKLGEQALRHEKMLETFEQDVATLGTIPVHPALAAASATTTITRGGGGRQSRAPSLSSSTASSSSRLGSGRIDYSISEEPPLDPTAGGGLMREKRLPSVRQGEEEEVGGSGRGGKTLLDCIPVEREQRLLESCRTSQRRFQQEAENVAQKFATIEKGILEQRGDPVTVNDAVQELLERARRLCRDQESKRAELEANYLESFNLAKESGTDDAEKQNAINRLTQLILESEKLVPMMKDNDQQTMAIAMEIATAKASLLTNLRQRLREVSRLQTDIGKIQKHQELVGMAWGQKEEQFEHLGKVARMPAAYNAFLREVLRQRRFHEDFEATVSDFCNSMAALRSSEIVSRQEFIQTHLGNLPPVFLEMAPGLRNMPPTFNPGPITPLRPGELPEVYPDPAAADEEVDGGGESASKEAGGAGSVAGSVTPEAAAAVVVAGAGAATAVAAAAIQSSAAETGSAAVSTQTTAAAVDGAAVSTQTAAAAAAVGGAAVSTQTAAASGAAVGTQTERDWLRPTNEGRSVEGDGGSGGTDDDVGGGRADAAAAESVEARGEGDAPVESVEERAAGQESGVARSISALEAENARLADELAKARSRLEELGTAAAGAPALESAPSEAERAAIEPDRSPGTTAAAAAAAASGGGDDAVVVPGAVEGEDPAPMPRGVGGEFARPRRSYSDVVVSGSGRRESAIAATASAAASAGGGGEVRGTGARRGSSKETKNQLAAYRAGLTMLVKLTDQHKLADQQRGGAAVGVASASAAEAASAVQPGAMEDPAVGTRATVTARTAAAEDPASPSSPTDSEGHPSPGSDRPTPATAVDGQATAGGGGDVGDAASPDVKEASERESTTVPDRAQEAHPAAAISAVEVDKDHATAKPAVAEATAPPEDRQGGARPAGEDSCSSPDHNEAASPERAATTPASTATGGTAVETAGGGLVARPSGSLGGVERIRRAADYVATHLQYNHALAAVPRISMCSFSVQDIALFLPTMVGSPDGSSGGPVFLAFHVNCPNRYLSEESINNARETLGASPAYILGRIILVEQHVASEEPNPYNVAPNTVYYVLTAENVG